jgi:hypothetical protein
MRIGIDVVCWSNRRGYGRFTWELLKALLRVDRKNGYLFFVDPQTNSMNNFPERTVRREVNILEHIVDGATDFSWEQSAFQALSVFRKMESNVTTS